MPHPIFRNNELWMRSGEYRSGALQPGRTGFAATSRGGPNLSPQSNAGQELVTVLVTIGGFAVFRNSVA